MRWQVEGADKVTGRERTYTIDADSREKAEQIAQLKGVLVSDVHGPAVARHGNGSTPIDVHGPITMPVRNQAAGSQAAGSQAVASPAAAFTGAASQTSTSQASVSQPSPQPAAQPH